MTAEMTTFEAEILIAVLTGAEAAFAIVNPPLVEACQALRPWRSALLQAYLRERIGSTQATGAVDPNAADQGTPTTRVSESSSADFQTARTQEPG